MVRKAFLPEASRRKAKELRILMEKQVSKKPTHSKSPARGGSVSPLRSRAANKNDVRAYGNDFLADLRRIGKEQEASMVEDFGLQ